MKFDKDKIKSIETREVPNHDGGVLIEFSDKYGTDRTLVGTQFVDRVVIGWTKDALGGRGDPPMRVIGVFEYSDGRSDARTIERFYEFEPLKALGWLAENMA